MHNVVLVHRDGGQTKFHVEGWNAHEKPYVRYIGVTYMLSTAKRGIVTYHELDAHDLNDLEQVVD